MQAIERLRANQTGTGSREFKWAHVFEALLEPKSWLFIGMTLLLNVGASVTNTFGPLLLSGLGYDKYLTSLLNMPFGAMQLLAIAIASWCAQKVRLKSPVLVTLVLPVIVGLVLLYVLKRTPSHQGALLAGYYLLGFLYGGNPVIVSWIVGNTGGTTKKSVLMSLYNAGTSAGNIVGPLLFSTGDAPEYHPGLRACLAIFVTLVAVVLIQLGNLIVLNKLHSRTRVRNGKTAVIHDASMESKYVALDKGNEGATGQRLGDNAFMDLTDRKNDEFVYVY